MALLSCLLQLVPEYKQRVWGGRRLTEKAGGGNGQPVGEAWLVYEDNQVAAGPWAGRTLRELSDELGPDLLGKAVETSRRFPLLIKLLDCADWLSVQVHPNDEQAARLQGPGQLGKTEAWHVLEAEPGARLISGVRAGTSAEALAGAIRGGTILDYVQYHTARAGDSFFIPAGTIHALGPGLFLYEIQQTSDITYRVFDWNRPSSQGRALHLEESVIAANPMLSGERRPAPRLGASDSQQVIESEYFALEVVTGSEQTQPGDTRGESCHVLTVIEGQVEAVCGEERLALQPYETVLIPAAAGAYALRPLGSFRVLRASV
jgi:mannose-6-phosphate isomerase